MTIAMFTDEGMTTLSTKVYGATPPRARAAALACCTQLSGREAMPKRSLWSANLKKSRATSRKKDCSEATLSLSLMYERPRRLNDRPSGSPHLASGGAPRLSTRPGRSAAKTSSPSGLPFLAAAASSPLSLPASVTLRSAGSTKHHSHSITMPMTTCNATISWCWYSGGTVSSATTAPTAPSLSDTAVWPSPRTRPSSAWMVWLLASVAALPLA
mmetsp:Transcript_15350/g.38060  ORF Transcript_15350/g.38060 Transcript_15350/m.38060 type:complete len:214 (+) Transcript_15350:685-1326(+)